MFTSSVYNARQRARRIRASCRSAHAQYSITQWLRLRRRRPPQTQYYYTANRMLLNSSHLFATDCFFCFASLSVRLSVCLSACLSLCLCVCSSSSDVQLMASAVGRLPWQLDRCLRSSDVEAFPSLILVAERSVVRPARLSLISASGQVPLAASKKRGRSYSEKEVRGLQDQGNESLFVIPQEGRTAISIRVICV